MWPSTPQVPKAGALCKPNIVFDQCGVPLHMLVRSRGPSLTLSASPAVAFLVKDLLDLWRANGASQLCGSARMLCVHLRRPSFSLGLRPCPRRGFV